MLQCVLQSLLQCVFSLRTEQYVLFVRVAVFCAECVAVRVAMCVAVCGCLSSCSLRIHNGACH